MTGMPADIDEAANTACAQWFDADNMSPLHEIIARALLAERERCARHIERLDAGLLDRKQFEHAIGKLVSEIRRGDLSNYGGDRQPHPS